MTESLIRENETHLCGPRGARKRHSKLARGPICCYFINRPASAGGGEVVTHLQLTKFPSLILRRPQEKREGTVPRAERLEWIRDLTEAPSAGYCAQGEFHLVVNPHHNIWSMTVNKRGHVGLFSSGFRISKLISPPLIYCYDGYSRRL